MGLIRLLTFITKEDSVKPVETYTEVSLNDEPKPSMMGVEKRITDIDLKIDSVFEEKRKPLDEDYNKAFPLVLNKDNLEIYEEYLKNGGKPLEKIQIEYSKITQNVKDAKDSLTGIYNRRIEVYLEENKSVLKSKIKDSLRDAGSALAYSKVSIEELVEKRKTMLRDSMSYRFGTKEKIDNNEAAVIYLSKLKNKSEAASCFEKGKQYKKGIDLYKELEQKEKVGDLYREIHDVANSNLYYQKVIDDYVKNNQMVKGSLIYRKKNGPTGSGSENSTSRLGSQLGCF